MISGPPASSFFSFSSLLIRVDAFSTWGVLAAAAMTAVLFKKSLLFILFCFFKLSDGLFKAFGGFNYVVVFPKIRILQLPNFIRKGSMIRE